MEQVQELNLTEVTAQLTTTQQTGGAASVGGTLATGAGTVDTRALGKPEVFEGVEAKWHDFRV
eukprot:4018606-Amphidinium_carterae.1